MARKAHHTSSGLDDISCCYMMFLGVERKLCMCCMCNIHEEHLPLPWQPLQLMQSSPTLSPCRPAPLTGSRVVLRLRVDGLVHFHTRTHLDKEWKRDREESVLELLGQWHASDCVFSVPSKVLRLSDAYNSNLWLCQRLIRSSCAVEDLKLELSVTNQPCSAGCNPDWGRKAGLAAEVRAGWSSAGLFCGGIGMQTCCRRGGWIWWSWRSRTLANCHSLP